MSVDTPSSQSNQRRIFPNLLPARRGAIGKIVRWQGKSLRSLARCSELPIAGPTPFPVVPYAYAYLHCTRFTLNMSRRFPIPAFMHSSNPLPDCHLDGKQSRSGESQSSDSSSNPAERRNQSGARYPSPICNRKTTRISGFGHHTRPRPSATHVSNRTTHPRRTHSPTIRRTPPTAAGRSSGQSP